MKRLGRYTIAMEHAPWVECYGAAGGKKEGQGPIGAGLDRSFVDTTLGEASWEKAESRLQQTAFGLALAHGRLRSEDIDLLFAGDLLNQCAASAFSVRGIGVPFFGQYGACSTMGQTIALAAMAVESGCAHRAAAMTSSHFCTAERQFRLPLEYGGQRSQTAQWTATGAGAVILASETAKQRTALPALTCEPEEHRISVAHVTPGRIADLGVKDAANMGAAMAPAAAQTLADFLEDTGTAPSDYDLILTGDLGLVGSVLLQQLLSEYGLDIRTNHQDCGLLLYDRGEQDVHAGGSGCGCSALVLCAKVLPELKKGLYRNVVFLPTGALMSTTTSQQGESIPGIAHLVHFIATPKSTL